MRGFKLFVIAALTGLLGLQALVIREMARQDSRHMRLDRINDIIDSLYVRKPPSVSHGQWDWALGDMNVCTYNALYRLDNQKLDALYDVFEKDAKGPVTVDTPRKWLTIMKDCCPEEAHYFEARLADVQDLFPDKKKK